MLEKVCHAIVDSNRRKILQILQNSHMSVGEIGSHFEISQPAISQHLRVLLDAQLVEVQQAGNRRLYRVRNEGFDELRDFIAQFWDQQLDILKFAAESEESRKQETDD